MLDRISRSWELGKQSWRVLRSDKQLVVFPLLSTAACLIVLASFALPVVLAVDFGALSREEGAARQAANQPLYYVVMFVFYFVNYAVIAFFNAGLIACAMRKFEGEDAGVGAGLRAAAGRLPQILGWAFIAATVGMVLRMISERSGLLGKIVISLIGFVWTVATYFVVPVLVVEGVGPVEAVKRSAAVIRKTWGEALVVNVGLGALSMAGFLASLVPLAAGIGLSVMSESPAPAMVGAAVMIGMLMVLALVTSTLKIILVAALYRYAATGLVPEQFDGRLLRQMFRKKGER